MDTPRDGNASLDPVFIEKHTRNISDVDTKIINLYTRGMFTRDISESIRDIYGIEVSFPMISKITDKIIPKARGGKEDPYIPCTPSFLLIVFTTKT